MSQEFVAHLNEIFDGAQAGFVHRWSACNYFDKVILANRTVPLLYWPGYGKARQVPGLSSSEGWDGVESIAGHLVLWRGDLIKWSGLNDFSMWIPVGETAASVRSNTLTSFKHPAVDEVTDWVYLDESDEDFVKGQYVRVDYNTEDPTIAQYHFYLIDSIATIVGVTATTLPVSHTIASGATAKIFTQKYASWVVGTRLLVDGRAKALKITKNSQNLTTVFSSSAPSETNSSIGGTFHIHVTENPSDLKVGDVVSLGTLGAPGEDLYEVMNVAFNLKLKRLGIGSNQHATGYVFPTGTLIAVQPFIEVENFGDFSVTIAKESDLSGQMAIKLKGLGLSGEAEPGSDVPVGVAIQSVDANEAGETVNAGSQINGDVYAIVSLGEYGTILKSRSIQSMHYVGRVGGTFFIRQEIQDDGLVARNAWKRVKELGLIFLGHDNLYQYSGGQNLTPICQQHIQAVFAELDRGRVDEVTFYHNESAWEVWMVYPTLKQEWKVLIYNYRFGSATVDLYDNDLGGITAVGSIDWEDAPTWESLPDTLFWEDDTKRWYEYVDEGLKRHTVIAVGGDLPTIPELGEDGDDGIPRLLLHGRKYSRASGDNCDPEAYLCLAETSDYDFGDGARWKYADTLQLHVDVESQLERPMNLWVQIGSRDNLDSDIRWSAASRVEVSGNGMRITKVNARSAGRFMRIRFYSEQIGIKWRIAGFKLIARPGGTY